MNENNIISSRSNFITYIKFALLQNRKALLLSALSIWAIYIFMGVIMGYNMIGGGKGEIITFSLIAETIAAVGASFAFSNMKTKEQRIYDLMIPASIDAKYFTRWIAIVPGLFLILVAGFYLGDLARIASFSIFNPYITAPAEYGNIIDIWGFYTGYGYSDAMLIFCLAFGCYFMMQSIYLFGAILWPKLSFIKTFAAVYVIQTVLGLTVMMIHKWISISFSIEDVIWLLWCVFSVMVVITVLCYILAYYRYRNSQVVYKLF